MSQREGVQQKQEPSKQGRTLSWSGLPRIWRLLGWVLLKDVRERQFAPFYEDMYQDYLLELRQLRVDQQIFRMDARRVLAIKFFKNVRFAFWVAKLIVECIWGTFKRRE
jgi:hypothetical protein